MKLWHALFGAKSKASATTAPNLASGSPHDGSNLLGSSSASRNQARPSLSHLFSFALIHKGDVDLRELGRILKAGADPNERDQNDLTPLHNAMAPGDLGCQITQLLIERGADVNAVNSFGRSPLHFAAQNKRYDNAEILLKAGASPEIKDQKGTTAIDIADTKMFEIIRAHTRKPIESTTAGGEGDLSTFGHLLTFSGSQCSVFVHNIRGNGYTHTGGEMIDEAHYAEHWSNGDCLIRVATDPEDYIWFLAFRAGNGSEHVVYRDGKRVE
jgi:hypothetical protein